jgi:hypothetical protein
MVPEISKSNSEINALALSVTLSGLRKKPMRRYEIIYIRLAFSRQKGYSYP